MAVPRRTTVVSFHIPLPDAQEAGQGVDFTGRRKAQLHEKNAPSQHVRGDSGTTLLHQDLREKKKRKIYFFHTTMKCELFFAV